MNGGPVVVGLDLGTSSVKAVAVNAELRVRAHVARRYPMTSPRPGWAEQDPEEVAGAGMDVLQTVLDTCRRDGHEVAGVGLSAALHSLLGVDAAGRPVTPALTYADGRATPIAARLRASAVGQALYHRTGVPQHPMAPLAKLAWFAEQQPDVAPRVVQWRSLKEHLLARLGADVVVDHSIASGTGLFDLRQRVWDAEALDIAGIDARQLAPLVPTTHVVHATGLEVPVVVGGGDGALANLGAGALAPGVAAVSIGTSGALRVVTGEPSTDAAAQVFCATLDDRHWVVGGAISNGGLVLRWLRDRLLGALSPAMSYEAMTALAADVDPGADGLLFVPSLTAERAPRWDAALGGALLGVELRHGAGHVVRAAMEGVALQLRWVAETLEAAGWAIDRIHATGGFTASRLWVQILADVLGREIVVGAHPEGSSLGAVLLGMVGLGLLPAVDAAATMVPMADRIAPRPETASVYAELSERFRAASRR